MRSSTKRGKSFIPSPSTPRDWRTPLAIAVAVVAVVFALRSSTAAEIDLTRLGERAPEPSDRATVILDDGRLANVGTAPAENLEIVEPSYRFLGSVGPEEAVAAPVGRFRIRYEWRTRTGIQRESKVFEDGVASTRSPRTQSPTATTPPAPEGVTATYDPASHMLTVRSAKPVSVRADGYLLRPVRRGGTEGIEYRYLPAHILVLGQNLQRGEAVTFEVVFTRAQDQYSIPLYIQEDGKEPVYVEVGIPTAAHQ